MMKKLGLIMSLVVCSVVSLLACSFYPYSFCHVNSNIAFSEHLVVMGEIVSIDEDGIDLEVIDVLRGEESKSIIRIWDGSGFCLSLRKHDDCRRKAKFGSTPFLPGHFRQQRRKTRGTVNGLDIQCKAHEISGSIVGSDVKISMERKVHNIFFEMGISLIIIPRLTLIGSGFFHYHQIRRIFHVH